MQKPTQKRELHVRWDVTSSRWLERNGMPNGTALVLERTKDGRQVRGDTIVHRQRLPPVADAADTVSDALEELRARLITDIAARRQRIRLYSPTGESISGNTLIGNVRDMTGLPIKTETTRIEFESDEIEHISEGVCQELDLNEEFASSPTIVLRAYVQALRTRFSAEQIVAVARSERAGG